jgi:hypothetical protein
VAGKCQQHEEARPAVTYLTCLLQVGDKKPFEVKRDLVPKVSMEKFNEVGLSEHLCLAYRIFIASMNHLFVQVCYFLAAKEDGNIFLLNHIFEMFRHSTKE